MAKTKTKAAEKQPGVSEPTETKTDPSNETDGADNSESVSLQDIPDDQIPDVKKAVDSRQIEIDEKIAADKLELSLKLAKNQSDAISALRQKQGKPPQIKLPKEILERIVSEDDQLDESAKMLLDLIKAVNYLLKKAR